MGNHPRGSPEGVSAFPSDSFHESLCYNQCPGSVINTVKTGYTLRSLFLPAAVGIGLLLSVAAPLAHGQALSRELLDQYCVACHNDSNRTANITLSALDPANVGAHADVWEKVLRKVSTRQMPPTGLPSPDDAVANTFTAALEHALDEVAAAHPDPGRPVIHRLNRNEYANAVRDLLAIEIDAQEELPADDTGYGFDNIADVLSFSPRLLERYISVARKVSRLAVGSTDIEPGQADWRMERRGTQQLRIQRVSDELPFSSRGGMSVSYYFPVDAEYVFKLDLLLQAEGENPPYQLRMPVKAGRHTFGATFFASGSMPEMAAPNGRRGGGPPARGAAVANTASMDIRFDGKRIKLEELELQGPDPQVTAVYIEGPYNITGPGDTPSRRAIFTCQPGTASEEEPCARKILTNLARKAYRRPATNDDVSPLMGLYQMGRREGGFEAGIQRALQAMLVSPNFLFRVERDPQGAAPGEAHRISELELASRLSFFLWSSIPDDELLSLAEQGKLREPGVLKAQVHRMLADQRSDSLVQNFAGQWLFLRKMDTVSPDAEQFNTFDVALRASMKRETELLFSEILRENRSVLRLLDANHTYLNQQLAEHYGVSGIYGSQFRRVELEDPNRRGLLGQASILTVTSYPNRTSVVLRGAWVLENLLGTPPPPPPPNVPPLEAATSDGKKHTLREAMELHRSNAICASCHARMDPIGLALENFDAIGRWRNEDGGLPIDTSGELPNGSSFDGPAGLTKLLAQEHRDDFVSTAVEKLLIYALGRGLEHYDLPVVRSILRETADNDYRMDDLIVSVVESTPFQMRRNVRQ